MILGYEYDDFELMYQLYKFDTGYEPASLFHLVENYEKQQSHDIVKTMRLGMKLYMADQKVTDVKVLRSLYDEMVVSLGRWS